MSYEQRNITAKKGQVIHVETPLGIVNIRVCLTDMRGRSVDSVQVIPDHYAGERKVVRRGPHNTRLVQLKRLT